jgi:hypothetical protein
MDYTIKEPDTPQKTPKQEEIKVIPKVASTKKTKKAKKGRIAKVAECLRRTAATARVSRKDLVDSKTFDSATYIREMSGKFSALIDTIKQIDALDMKKDGHLYKHFIFTDIRESSYGAKALAGFLIASGFDFRQGVVKKMVKRGGEMVETKTGATILLEKEPVEGGSNGFALLQSVPLFKNPMSVPVKKRILQVFNSRPDNIHGELLRIVVLDSKYKEGIDLFDVKYVHLLEPAIATSDLKQAVGRATRFCGQKGLQFVPNKGWPLEVFIYRTELPGRLPFAKENAPEGQKVDAHTLMLEKSGLDLALLNLTQDLTALAIRTSVDYDLNYRINNFNVEAEHMEAVEAVVEVTSQKGGKKPIVAIHDVADITPELLMKCSRRKSKLFPYTKGQIAEKAEQLGIRLGKTAKRMRACEVIKSHPKLLEYLLKPQSTTPLAMQRLFKTRKPTKVKRAKTQKASTVSPVNYGNVSSPLKENNYSTALALQRMFATPSISRQMRFPLPSAIPSVSGSALQKLFKTPKITAQLDRIAKLPFNEFQEKITQLYSSFAWASPIVKSGCDSTTLAAPGRPVTFSKTQDFVRHYLTPGSPFKGLLAWHSVGTGKTCMAVAAATTEFEAAGYNILWVTRNALMADVYKNIFGSVCSAPLIKEIEENGLVIPSDRSKAKRLLSRSWFAPITYRMLQNALKKENALGRSLYEANPDDPLKKTFLIIDEIHKLQDGDLSAGEVADFNYIREHIWKSYAASGDDSVRPLVMTATPITDTPKELFEILNILIPKETNRLMEFNTYREKFSDEAGHINEEGKEYFQNRAKGLISYLNREYDPTTFAQPKFHQVIVPVGEAAAPDMDELITKCTADLTLEVAKEVDGCDDLVEQREAELEEIKAMPKKEAKGLAAAVKAEYKTRISDCKKAMKAAKKGNKSAMKELLKTASLCYRKTKKAYTAKRKASQMIQIESCLGKPPASTFMPQKLFKAEVVERFMNPDPKLNSVGAVIDV